MENTQKDLSRTLFHAQILESELGQLSLAAQKAALQSWVNGIEELAKKDKATQTAAFSADILEKLLGYSVSGNTIAANTDQEADSYFDLYLGQAALAKPVAAVRLEPEGISGDTEAALVAAARQFTNLADNGFYILASLGEIRLYPANRKEKVCERFALADLLANDNALARFYLLLNSVNLLSGKTAQLLHDSSIRFLNEKLTKNYPTFKEVYGDIQPGIASGLDAAFIIDKETKEALVKEDPRSEEILKPYVEKEDLDRWLTESRSLWLIYTPENKVDIEQYPAVKKHLLPFKSRLEKRQGSQKWYELQEISEHAGNMFGTKLGFSKQSHDPTFAIDKDGGVYDNSGLYTTALDYYQVALLNSSVLWYLIRNASTRQPDGSYELTASGIEQLPIPDAPGLVRGRMGQLSDFCQDTTITRNNLIKYFRGQTAFNLLPNGLKSQLTPLLKNWFVHEFETFRSEIVDAFKTDIPADDLQLWNDYFYQERNKVFNLNADIARAEKEIDTLVYELFELTPDEIDLIERAV